MLRFFTHPESRDHDPEFDLLRPPVGVSPEDLRPHQRFLINPWLVLFGLILWVSALFFTRMHADKVGYAIILVILSVSYLPRLLHYHCVYCGETLRHPMHANHYCRAVAEQVHGWEKPAGHWPGVETQVRFWSYVMAIGGFLFVAHLMLKR